MPHRGSLIARSFRHLPQADAHEPVLVLASSSRYRGSCSRACGWTSSLAPDIDEKPLPGEAPASWPCGWPGQGPRRSPHRFPAALIIGSDQVAMLGARCSGKPGNHAAARDSCRR